MILEPGMNLTLRPMKYPTFYEMYKTSIKNNWTVEEVDFSRDVNDLENRMSPAERHLIYRLVAFFATGDSIVANNLVLNLYKHINAPEARMYLSRQLFEEAVHIQFYLTLLDTYIPDLNERARAFAAVENVPSIKKKADFCFQWQDSIYQLGEIRNRDEQKKLLLNLIAFAACTEGLFFFAAFSYVYFLRSKGLLNGLAAGTNWVFRDESAHIAFAFEVISTIRKEDPTLFDVPLQENITTMMRQAIEAEMAFSEDLLTYGVAGLSAGDMRKYLEFVADQRLASLEMEPLYHSKNPFDFMDLQDVQELANFFERRVSAYQVGIAGQIAFDVAF